MAQHPDHAAANQRLENTLPQNPLRTSSPSTEEHRAEAPGKVRCFVLTVSDTRDAESDTSGFLIRDALEDAGHAIVGSRIVRDEESAIVDAVRTATDGIADPEVIVVTGGSGIGARDVSPEALRPLLTKELPGFGEIFRVLSFEEIGAAAMLSRAFAGVIGRTLLFVLPGSTNAVKLAMHKLIVPELGHLVREVRPERRGE
ncbi:MAG TPA: molybdenum cofactor biosynthesis protein B [Abditibacteriaceae bacterium]|jgi:molybdenum cofactor biosynthesis protein B